MVRTSTWSLAWSTWSLVLGASNTVWVGRRPMDGHLSSKEEVLFNQTLTYPHGQ